MDVHESIDNGSTVKGRHRQTAVSNREVGGWVVRRKIEVEGVREFHTDLIQSLVRPVTKPIQHATIEQGGRSGGSRRETILRRIHREDYMQILRHLLREPLI